MIVKAIRNILGWSIAGVDLLTRGKALQRSPEAQRAVEATISEELALYQFFACPFCIKTRRAMAKLNLPVPFRDALNDEQHRQALLQGGGRVKVPCLRIEQAGDVRWLYESNDIIHYLEQRFASQR